MRELTTERLRLRPWRPDDPSDVAAALAIHGQPAMARFIPSAYCTDEGQARAVLERLTAYDSGDVLGIPAIEARATGEAVGLILLKPIPPSGRAPDAPTRPAPGETWDIEIGWRVAPTHAGHGYVTEAAAAVLDRGLATYGRVVAVTAPANVASQAVAERLGMRRVGLSSDYYDAELVLFEARR